jgi:PhnB protein
MVQAIPAGYAGVTPYLIVRDAARMLDFYKKGLGASEVLRLPAPGGKIGHAEIKIGEGMVMLADESPEMGHKSPQTVGGTPITLMFYVQDVDAQFAKALAAGGTVKHPVKDQFYGDRSGTLEDPSGHIWTIATHTEDVAPDEMDRRMKEMMEAGQ